MRPAAPFHILEPIELRDDFHILRAKSVSDSPEICVVKRPAEWGVAELEERLFHEARLLQSIAHPNLVRLIEYADASSREGPYLVAEHLTGQHLAPMLRALRRQGARLPIELALLLARDIAAALCQWHAAVDRDGSPLQLCIRDLGTHSLMISRSGIWKLTDLDKSASRFYCPPLESKALQRLSAFSAPELIVPGRSVDQRADIYSAGAVFFELLTSNPLVSVGTPLTQQTVDRMAQRMFRDLHPVPSDVAPELALFDPIVTKAVHYDPDGRYAAANQLLAAIEQSIQLGNFRCSREQLREFLGKLAQDDTRRASRSLGEEAQYSGSDRIALRAGASGNGSNA